MKGLKTLGVMFVVLCLLILPYWIVGWQRAEARNGELILDDVGATVVLEEQSFYVDTCGVAVPYARRPFSPPQTKHP